MYDSYNILTFAEIMGIAVDAISPFWAEELTIDKTIEMS